MANEQGIQLQADSLSPVPGGPIRMAAVTMLVNGVPTQVLMQVVSDSNADGVVVDAEKYMSVLVQTLQGMQADLRETRKLLAAFMGVPVLDADLAGVNTPANFGLSTQ